MRKTTKISLFDRFYIFSLILISGLGIYYFRELSGIVFIFIINVLFIYYHKIRLNSNFYIIIGIWLLYCIIVGLLFRDFSPLFITRQIIYISITYTLVVYFKDNFFKLYVRNIFILSVISLIFWFWQVIDVDSLANFMLNIGIDTYFGREYALTTNIYKSIGIYTYSNILDYDVIPRNYGFCWEPGPFAIFILIALYFNLMINGVKFSKMNSFFIFMIITTQSTSALIGIFFLILYIFYKKTRIGFLKIILIPIYIAGSTFLYFNFDVFEGKIDTQIESSYILEESMQMSSSKNKAFSAGRFGGFVIAWNDIKKYPIFGVGNSIESSFGSSGSTIAFAVNGIATIITIYGLFGIFIFLYFTHKSSLYYSKKFNSKLPLAFMIIMLTSYFAFGLFNLVIIFCITFYSFFTNNNYSNKKKLRYEN